MRIRFTAPVIFETEGPRCGPSFAKDHVEDMRDDMARRWIRRGVAVEVPLELPEVFVPAVVDGGDQEAPGKDEQTQSDQSVDQSVAGGDEQPAAGKDDGGKAAPTDRRSDRRKT